MIRFFSTGFLTALLAGALLTPAWGQAGVPPGQGKPAKPPLATRQGKPAKPPLATRQQPARNTPPPGPKPEDLLRLLLPPEPSPTKGNQIDQSAPRRGAINPPDSRGQMARSESDARLSVPSASDVERMSSRQQQALLRKALASLDGDLAKLSSSENWQAFLQIDALGSTLWCRSEPDPDEESQQVLRQIIERFRQVNSEPKFQAVRDLWGFQTAHALLPDYAAGQVKKDQRSLRTSVAALNKALDAQQSAAGWKKHLKTYELERLSSKTVELMPDDQDVFAEIAKLHDEVEQDPKYRSVAALPGFAQSRVAARRLAETLAKKKFMQPAAQERGQESSARTDAARMEKIVAGLLDQLQSLKQKCSEESQARQTLSAINFELAVKGAGDKAVLARRSAEAGEVLRQAKQRHEEALRAAEDDLRNMLQAIKSGSTTQAAGESVLILPLGVDSSDKPAATILPLGTGKSDKPAATILPLETGKSDKPAATILPLGTDSSDKTDAPTPPEKSKLDAPTRLPPGTKPPLKAGEK